MLNDCANSGISAVSASVSGRAQIGQRLSRQDALTLVAEDNLSDLLTRAASLRGAFKGNTASYSKKVFIPLTHLCRDYCGYCTFRSDPQSGLRPYMTPEEVLA